MDTFFGKVKNPCDDCVDGECTMNCSGREPAQADDKGSFGVTREKDGTVTVLVRSPGQYAESSVTMMRNVWNEVSSGPFAAEYKARLVDQRGTDVIGTGPACAACGLISIPNCENPACAFRPIELSPPLLDQEKYLAQIVREIIPYAVIFADDESHVNDLRERAEKKIRSMLSLSPAPHAEVRAITDEMVEAAAREMWNDRDARMGGTWESRDPQEVCVAQTKATARAALTAALAPHSLERGEVGK